VFFDRQHFPIERASKCISALFIPIHALALNTQAMGFAPMKIVE
jgi:hypothetical protein